MRDYNSYDEYTERSDSRSSYTGSSSRDPQRRSSSVGTLGSSERRSSSYNGTARRSTSSDPSRRSSSSARARIKANMRRKKKFKKLFLIYVTVLVILLIAFGIFFSIYLSNYESGQPTHVASSVVDTYSSQEGIVNFVKENAEKTSLMGSVDEIAQLYATNIAGKDISYKENSDFRPSSPSYDITADGATVAKITLESSGTGAFGTPKWELSALDITDYLPDSYTVTLEVPSGSVVTVNDRQLDASYIVSSGIPSVLESSVSLIAEAPVYDTYKLSGLVSDPTIQVTDASGKNLTVSETTTGYVASDTDQNFIMSVEDRVYDTIDNYATYFINMSYDLKYYICSGSDLFSYIFGKEGEMDPIATSLYMWEDIEYYDFIERSADNYVKYADDCFTVDIKYALDMHFTNPDYSDENQKLDATWVYVIDDYDGSWCISDIITH